jgi:hypothetical protein
MVGGEGVCEVSSLSTNRRVLVKMRKAGEVLSWRMMFRRPPMPRSHLSQALQFGNNRANQDEATSKYAIIVIET